MNPKVDWYFTKEEKWNAEVNTLRSLILSCDLNEELKWGCPCYTYNKRNIVLIHSFKDYCALLFFKGALMKDPKRILVQQTENVQAARQVRFTDLKQITKLEKTLKQYVYEAVGVEEKGVKVPLKKTDEFNMPDEFRNTLQKNRALKKAFEALTPGRQRGYLLYFAAAKQSKTREARIKKFTPQMLEGKGLND
jgi:uncharacterized protein YdeI (YjbR/CyaY-like superfamily)